MQELWEQIKIGLDIKNYSPKTKEAYLNYLKNFTKYFAKSPIEMGEPEIKQYLHHLITSEKRSGSYVNGTYSALKFFYEKVLQREWNIGKIPRPKSSKRLPIVLSTEEIKSLLDVTLNIKHKAMLMTTYSAGLRVSETAHLKVIDIDSKRMQLRINQGKGKKDRYTLLSAVNLKLLREYWKQYRPNLWLFPGRSPERTITTRSIQKVFEKAKEKASIKKPATVHSIRHSFATHLLESGVGIYHIQHLMGHNSPKTTAIYIYLRRQDILKITSPLDLLLGDNND